MPGTGNLQHRGSNIPTANGLLQRLQNIEFALGLQGASAKAYFAVKDASNHVRAQIGYLPSGDYGILLQSPLGAIQELNPIVSGYGAGPVTTTSSTPVTLSDGIGALSVNIGASGDCIITISGVLNSTTAATYSQVGLSVNGGTTAIEWLLTQATYEQTCSATYQLSKVTGTHLTPGTNTFQLLYSCSTSSDTANFRQMGLVVQPI